MVVLVIFPSGQSGLDFQKLQTEMPEHQFIFANKFQVDTSNAMSITSIIKQHRPHLVFNTTDFEMLEMICAKKGIGLAHISQKSAIGNLRQKIRQHQ